MTLTKNDLTQIGNIVEDTLDKKLDEKFDEKFKFLPSKDEFYTKMDEVMGELSTHREERTILGHQVSENRQKIEKLEETVSGNGAAATA